jgi:HTH-type transcriptional regulator, sugar sensing transcriptional regulator
MDIQQTLEQLGLDGKKAKVYLAALQLGTASAQEVAKKAGLKRPTATEILEGLVERGLVSFVTEKRTRLFTVEPPQKLIALLQEQERQTKMIIPQLEAMYGKAWHRPRVQFYEGIEGIKTVYEDTLTTSTKELRGILSMQDLYRIPGKAYMDDYVQRRIGAGIALKVIRSESKEVEATWFASHREKRELHLAPKGMDFAMTMYLYDDKVALIGTEKEPFGLIMHSKDFYQTQLQFFETLWQVTRVAKAIG